MISWTVAAELDEAMQEVKRGLDLMGVSESDSLGQYYERLRADVAEVMSHIE